MCFKLASIRSGIGENMNDRYLFKAKDCNSIWRAGLLIALQEGRCAIEEKDGSKWACDSETLCQCTGLKDKNGKLIWENDIVKINNSKVNVLITFRDFEIICTIPSEKYYKHRLEYDTEYEVIGNIFDNPELLESEE